jgi:hypothetical protein
LTANLATAQSLLFALDHYTLTKNVVINLDEDAVNTPAI